MLGGGALGVLLVLWVGSRLLHGGGGGDTLLPSGPTGPTGVSGGAYASPPPPGSVSATFPLPPSGPGSR